MAPPALVAMLPRSAVHVLLRAALVVGALGAPAVGRAQLVRVTLRDSLSNAPVAAALVAATDAAGRVLVERLTDRDGGATLALPAPGTVQLRVRRIGIVPTVVPGIVVRADSAVVMQLYPDPALPPAFQRWRGIGEPRTLGRVAAQADSARDRRLQAEACAILMRDTVPIAP